MIKDTGNILSMSEPKLFISYSWSSTEHEEWVMRLSTELRESGVDVKLDKWDLKEGNDANVFMEKMVTDDEINKVILVIDDEYTSKANKRAGGVGTEAQIISAEVYESADQNKFVAVIAHKDDEGNANLPAFYKSRIYIDLSDHDSYGKNFEQLLRWIYDKPLNIKPELGKKPTFLDEETDVSLGTFSAAHRFIEAIKNSRPHALGALKEYCNLFSENLNRFRLEPSNGAEDFDQQVVDNIEKFIPSRNELIEVFSSIAQYDGNNASGATLHKFFELLIPYLNRPEGVNSDREWDYDNLKFLIQESYILCIAVLLKYGRFDIINCLVNERYYIQNGNRFGENTMKSFDVFCNHLTSLDYRNEKLNPQRLSLHADIMRDRCTDSGVSFEYIMQADFLLYVASSIQGLNEERRSKWWSETLLFKSFHDGGAFEIFLRSESTEYFNQVADALGIKHKEELEPFIAAFKARKIYIPKWGYRTISPLELMNYDNLCNRA